MLAKVPPVGIPSARAALLAAAAAKAPPGIPGAMGISVPLGLIVQLVTVGGLASTLVDNCRGYKSLKIPIPPRTTVFFPGFQANPPRGSHTIRSRPGKIVDWPVRIDWL